ncbi:lysozyme inhibitor LprI family protein [Lysobacter capsici]|uniref:lysozyme inhibitor LprI family protein n=1 Tax=Lysobacter capsici TaxID=435897 RepID=UPI00287BA378|nr:lysozyme inhibitor LprI family protein [Lysobacter capsici]WND78216.1 lysozyme inhibitor LprI family protein [Lysobacter capsici]WND83410.1 lysozyme inhibitor LprI family protein [Lysobacter capsici]
MKTIFCAAALSLLGLASFAANAQGECDKYRTSYDKTYCFAKLFLESDKELNTAYKDLRAVAKEAANQKLKATQLDWIKYRDATCESSGSINVDCNYRVNRERTEYLRDRARECKAGTCRDEMIGKKSWN